MANKAKHLRDGARHGAVCLLMWLAGSAVAAPAIQGVSGTFSHKGSVTITGSGFGAKAVAAPVIWDDASDTNILNKWSGYWPNSGTLAYQLKYTNPINGMPLPHSHAMKYIAGAHGDAGSSGYDVILWKTRTISAYPAYTYASWYHRSSDSWHFFGDGSDNYKSFAFASGNGPYTGNNWYAGLAPLGSASATPQWGINDDAQPPSLAGGSLSWQGIAVNPMAGRWAKVELEIKYTNQTDGYVKLWENGVLRLNYAGPTDKYPGTTRTEGFGGYARPYGYSTNYRYFADIYLDYTPARVVLANASVLSKATIIETQIPTAWSATSVSISVNLGNFSSGQTAYLFAVDSSGTPNGAGFPITVGGSVSAQLPPPTNLHVQ